MTTGRSRLLCGFVAALSVCGIALPARAADEDDFVRALGGLAAARLILGQQGTVDVLRDFVEAKRQVEIEKIHWASEIKKAEGIKLDNEKKREKLKRWIYDNKVLQDELKVEEKLVEPVSLDDVAKLNQVLQQCISLDSIYEQPDYNRYINGRCSLRVADDLDLSKLNVTSFNLGNPGLLKSADFPWPMLLRRAYFDSERKEFERLLAIAKSQAVNSASRIDGDIMQKINAVKTELRSKWVRHYLEQKHNARTYTFTMQLETEYFFLRSLPEMLNLLNQPNVKDHLLGQYTLRDQRTAPEIVAFMSAQGLVFAKPTPGTETAYLAVYRKLFVYKYALREAHALRFQKEN